jgi:hypothetical protein
MPVYMGSSNIFEIVLYQMLYQISLREINILDDYKFGKIA